MENEPISPYVQRQINQMLYNKIIELQQRQEYLEYNLNMLINIIYNKPMFTDDEISVANILVNNTMKYQSQD